MPKTLSKFCKIFLFISYLWSDCYFSANFSAIMVLLNSGWIPKRSQISGVNMVGRGALWHDFWYEKTVNILPQKISDAPNPFGSRPPNNSCGANVWNPNTVQNRWKLQFLRWRPFYCFLALLFTINLVKIAVFLKLIGHYIKFKRMPIPNHFQCLKSIGKAINHYHCLMKPMQLGFNNGNTGVAGILQKQQ